MQFKPESLGTLLTAVSLVLVALPAAAFVTPVPEPGIASLFGAGLIGIILFARYRRK